MKFALAALLGVASAVDKDTEMAFISFIAENGKSYGTREEYEFRLAQFSKKVEFVQQHNALNADDHFVGINHMADWTDHEYKKLLGFKHHNKKAHKKHHKHVESVNVSDIPASVDWRTLGAVTPVKNQAQCGSCWAFSATGAMEGRYQIKNNTLVSFSEQQLVDCSKAQGNEGCNGGLMNNAFTYAESNTMDKEDSYPYTGRDGTCHATAGVA